MVAGGQWSVVSQKTKTPQSSLPAVERLTRMRPPDAPNVKMHTHLQYFPL